MIGLESSSHKVPKKPCFRSSTEKNSTSKVIKKALPGIRWLPSPLQVSAEARESRVILASPGHLLVIPGHPLALQQGLGQLQAILGQPWTIPGHQPSQSILGSLDESQMQVSSAITGALTETQGACATTKPLAKAVRSVAIAS